MADRAKAKAQFVFAFLDELADPLGRDAKLSADRSESLTVDALAKDFGVSGREMVIDGLIDSRHGFVDGGDLDRRLEKLRCRFQVGLWIEVRNSSDCESHDGDSFLGFFEIEWFSGLRIS